MKRVPPNLKIPKLILEFSNEWRAFTTPYELYPRTVSKMIRPTHHRDNIEGGVEDVLT